LRNPEQSSTNAALNDVRQAAALNERESELLRRSGERIFALSRKVAAAEREIERLRTELHQSQLLADEVRRTRDVLSAQVTALLNERDRDYMERAELRRLLASLQSQMQTILANVVTGSSVDSANAPRLIGRALPQRGGHVPMALPAAR
jgi:hypothetical protein